MQYYPKSVQVFPFYIGFSQGTTKYVELTSLILKLF